MFTLSPVAMKNTGNSSSTVTCSSRSRISWLRGAASSRGMIAPNTNAPKIAWIPIQFVMYAETSTPTRTTAKMLGVSPPATRRRSTRDRSRGRTIRNMRR